ncbi:MAG: septation protein SepH [Bifidobacterium sp.]|jgi:hypothetical protein|nr:septation protein SepH [Bifidobacterium sp.]
MPEKPLTQANFVAVGAAGELILSVGGARFALAVDDALERAVLEAKQIKAESLGIQQPAAGQSLPISQIQTLIRAGAEPARVAQRYGLSPALVRRFSASVQTEKQYAIEQFLAVPAPKESRVHTMAELIERALASARIGMETVQWKATRRGLEPWKISAEFDSAGRRLRAEWTWNMHDNAVVSLNSAARRLVGELSPKDRDTEGAATGTSGELDDAFSIVMGIPGDSIRSARIERAVSAWGSDGSDSRNTETQSTAADQEGAARATAAQGAAVAAPQGTVSSESQDRGDQDSGTHNTSGETQPSHPLQPARTSQASEPSVQTQLAANAQTSLQPQHDYDDRKNRRNQSRSKAMERSAADQAFAMPLLRGSSHSTEPNPASTVDTNASDLTDAQSGTLGTAGAPQSSGDVDGEGKDLGHTRDKAGSSEPAKRKSRRSAVPSWDEILFGD